MAYLKLPVRAPEYRLVMLMTSPIIYILSFLFLFIAFFLMSVSFIYIRSKYNTWSHHHWKKEP
jgi:hypothetical protein